MGGPGTSPKSAWFVKGDVLDLPPGGTFARRHGVYHSILRRREHPEEFRGHSTKLTSARSLDSGGCGLDLHSQDPRPAISGPKCGTVARRCPHLSAPSEMLADISDWREFPEAALSILRSSAYVCASGGLSEVELPLIRSRHSSVVSSIHRS